MSKLSFWPHFC